VLLALSSTSGQVNVFVGSISGGLFSLSVVQGTTILTSTVVDVSGVDIPLVYSGTSGGGTAKLKIVSYNGATPIINVRPSTWVTTWVPQTVLTTVCNGMEDRYRFGFNGKQKGNEIAGAGNSIDYVKRMYDPRLARFRSVDPIAANFPMLTPYQFASNTPIQAIDLDGKEAWVVIKDHYEKSGATQISIVYDFNIRAEGDYRTLNRYHDAGGFVTSSNTGSGNFSDNNLFHPVTTTTITGSTQVSFKGLYGELAGKSKIGGTGVEGSVGTEGQLFKLGYGSDKGFGAEGTSLDLKLHAGATLGALGIDVGKKFDAATGTFYGNTIAQVNAGPIEMTTGESSDPKFALNLFQLKAAVGFGVDLSIKREYSTTRSTTYVPDAKLFKGVVPAKSPSSVGAKEPE